MSSKIHRMQVITHWHQTHTLAVTSAEKVHSRLRSAVFLEPIYCYTSYTI